MVSSRLRLPPGAPPRSYPSAWLRFWRCESSQVGLNPWNAPVWRVASVHFKPWCPGKGHLKAMAGCSGAYCATLSFSDVIHRLFAARWLLGPAGDCSVAGAPKTGKVVQDAESGAGQ